MSGKSYSDLISGGVVATTDIGINVQSSAIDITLTEAKRIQRINMTAGSRSLLLPPATGLSIGTDFVIDNVGANNFTVKGSAGSSIITAVISNTYYVYLVSKATAEGTWGARTFGGGGASAGANSDITSLSGLTTPLSLAQGGTGANLSATGGTSHYVKQASSGAVFTVGAIAVADYATMVGDSGAGGTKGAVPAPAAGDAAAQKYLGAGGTWSTPSGTGASASEAYVTIGNTSGLSDERALAAGAGITLTDNGAGATASLAVTNPVPAPSGNALSMPRVNAGATALEYRTMTQVTAALDAATPTLQGAVELATTAEVQTGTDTTRAVTAAGVTAAAVLQGKKTIWVPAAAMVPRTTNGAALGTSEMTTNKNMLRTLDFDTTTQEFAQFEVAFPKSWNLGTVTFMPHWTAASGSGTVVFALQGVATSNDDTLDVAFGTEQTSSDTLITALDRHVGPESAAITIGGTPVAEDGVHFQIKRNVASDNLGVDAKLIGIKLFYTVNVGTDA